MKILIIAAHPDDEVLGMGGTMKKLSKSGNDINESISPLSIFIKIDPLPFVLKILLNFINSSRIKN